MQSLPQKKKKKKKKNRESLLPKSLIAFKAFYTLSSTTLTGSSIIERVVVILFR